MLSLSPYIVYCVNKNSGYRDMKIKTILAAGLTILIGGMIASCGPGGEDSKVSWKVKEGKERAYIMHVKGTDLLDLNIKTPDEEKDSLPPLKKRNPVKSYLKQPKLKITVKGSDFLVVSKAKPILNKINNNKFTLEHIIGKIRYTSPLDAKADEATRRINEALFRAAQGLTLGKYKMDSYGKLRPSATEQFKFLNMLMRTPPDAVLASKKKVMMFPLSLKKDDPEVCAGMPIKKILSRKLDAYAKQKGTYKLKNGDVIVEVAYRAKETISNVIEKEDPATKGFIGRYNSANQSFRNRFRPMIIDGDDLYIDDDNKRTFLCEYKGVHRFNVTKGWLEGVEAKFAVYYIDKKKLIVRDISGFNIVVAQYDPAKIKRKTTEEYHDVLNTIDDRVLSFPGNFDAINDNSTLVGGAKSNQESSVDVAMLLPLQKQASESKLPPRQENKDIGAGHTAVNNNSIQKQQYNNTKRGNNRAGSHAFIRNGNDDDIRRFCSSGNSNRRNQIRIHLKFLERKNKKSHQNDPMLMWLKNQTMHSWEKDIALYKQCRRIFSACNCYDTAGVENQECEISCLKSYLGDQGQEEK